MSVDIPTTLQAFVNDELSAGKFANESELVAKALETYLEMQRRYSDLKGRVERSLDQLENGLVAPLDMDDVKDRVRRFAETNNRDSK